MPLEKKNLDHMDSFYKEVFENTSDVIFTLSSEGKFTTLNPAFALVSGFSSSEWVGKSLASLLHPEDLATAKINTRRVMEGKETTTHEYRILTKSGAYITAEIKSVPHISGGKIVGIMGIARDISERKRVEEAILEREAHFRSVAETATDSIISVNNSGEIIFWNSAAERLFGYTSGEVLGNQISLIIPERLRDTHSQGFKRILGGGEPRILGKSIEISAIRKDGKEFPVELSLASWESKGRTYFTAIIRDITRRKAAEAAILESENKYRIITEKSLLGVYIIQDGIFRFVNDTLCRLLGYTPDEIIGKMGPEDFTHPDYVDLLQENIRKRMEGEVEAISYDLVVQNKEGNSIPVKVLGQITEYKGEPAIMGTLLDRSREMELEKQLLHSQKMEAIGKLAGGIAHDFNNILTAIIGFGSVLKIKLPPDFPEKGQVDQILAAAERGANLTKSLLTFSRKQMHDFAPTGLNEAVSNVKTLIERIIGEDVPLNLSLAPEDLIVSANVGLLEQVLMNLSVNARDAMPEGGTLSIETASIQVDEKSAIDLGIGNPGKYAILKVSDTGVGIDEENIERIFDPFFTTKGVGKGTGLGLSIVYGIIMQHGGHISVSSEPGGATVFTIYLPLSSENRDIKAFPRKHDDLSGEESILIAEDDSTIRDVFVDVLTRFGYEVIEAGNGREALQKYDEKRGSIDILLFDVVMPEMNGWEAYLKIKEMKPEAKVIFMSAYTADTIKKQGLLTDGIRLLPKPLSPVEMLRTVREVLDR